MAEAFELDPEECVALLRSQLLGRVAITTSDGPHIVPVNYSVVEEMIVFRTTPYSLLGIHGMNVPIAFEVDQADHEHRTGWSVVARGVSEPIADPDEIERINGVRAPDPWAAGQRVLYVGVPWTELTGRRLGARTGHRLGPPD